MINIEFVETNSSLDGKTIFNMCHDFNINARLLNCFKMLYAYNWYKNVVFYFYSDSKCQHVICPTTKLKHLAKCYVNDDGYTVVYVQCYDLNDSNPIKWNIEPRIGKFGVTDSECFFIINAYYVERYDTYSESYYVDIDYEYKLIPIKEIYYRLSKRRY